MRYASLGSLTREASNRKHRHFLDDAQATIASASVQEEAQHDRRTRPSYNDAASPKASSPALRAVNSIYRARAGATALRSRA
jgi:hypothetical protein